MNETQRRDKLRQVWIDRWRLETIKGEELGSEDNWGRIDRRLRYFDAIGNEVLLPPHVDPQSHRLSDRCDDVLIELNGRSVQAWLFTDAYGNRITIPYFDVADRKYLVPGETT